MSGRRRIARAALVPMLAFIAGASSVPAAVAAAPPARVQGRFTMRTVVTSAVNVRGEHRGERLTRTWRIHPSRCLGDVCQVLHLQRTRGYGRRLWLTLHLSPDGSWIGHGSFFVALSCRGRIHRHGARVPYTIRLRVGATRTLGAIRFARSLRATYVNRRRIDRTRCAIPPSYDAARYTGRLRSGLPSPPLAAFTTAVGPSGLVAFSDASRPGRGPGRRVVAWSWNFGDPGSGAANGSALEAPTHQFPAPGAYVVSLTAVDGAGLQSTVAQTVVVAAVAPPSSRRTQPSAERTVVSTRARSVTSAAIVRVRGITTAYTQHNRPSSV